MLKIVKESCSCISCWFWLYYHRDAWWIDLREANVLKNMHCYELSANGKELRESCICQLMCSLAIIRHWFWIQLGLTWTMLCRNQMSLLCESLAIADRARGIDSADMEVQVCKHVHNGDTITHLYLWKNMKVKYPLSFTNNIFPS